MSSVESETPTLHPGDTDFKSAKVRQVTLRRVRELADDCEATGAEIFDAGTLMFEQASERRRREVLNAVLHRFPRSRGRVGRGNRKRVA